jgi:hypothetical protein
MQLESLIMLMISTKFGDSLSVNVDFDFGAILAEASKIYEDYIRRKEEIQNNRIDNFYAMLDMVEKLSDKHMKAIKEVVSPISEKNDLLSTCRRYRKLINDQDFPNGYGWAQGVIEETKRVDPFKKEPVRTNLDRLSTKLAYFQWAVFVFQYDSYNVASFTNEAQQLWYELTAYDPLPSTALERKLKVQEMIQAAFDWLNWEKRYVFRWDSVPGSDEEVLKEFLKKSFALEWIDTLQFHKENDNKKISASTKGLFTKHKLYITINERNEVVVEVDEKKSEEELEASLPPWNGYTLSVCKKSKEQPTMVPSLQTPDDVTQFVRNWYIEWIHHVQQTLYYDLGLFYAIGLFQLDRP